MYHMTHKLPTQLHDLSVASEKYKRSHQPITLISVMLPITKRNEGNKSEHWVKPWLSKHEK